MCAYLCNLICGAGGGGSVRCRVLISYHFIWVRGSSYVNSNTAAVKHNQIHFGFGSNITFFLCLFNMLKHRLSLPQNHIIYVYLLQNRKDHFRTTPLLTSKRWDRLHATRKNSHFACWYCEHSYIICKVARLKIPDFYKNSTSIHGKAKTSSYLPRYDMEINFYVAL